CVLVAESFSGPLAVTLAARYPARVAGLVLCASFVSSPLPGWLAWLNHPLWFRWQPPAWLAARALAMSDCDPAVVDLLLRTAGGVPAPVLSQRVGQVLRTDVRRELLEGAPVPLLYLRARRDRLVGSRSWLEIARLRPDARCVEVDASHFLLQHRPDECIRAIVDFLCRSHPGNIVG
ncbi:MAG: alpha/beta hydrolase, partial [Candidatus Eremiobacterota bacterium]